MSTDPVPDTNADADATPTFEPRDGEHGEDEAKATNESRPKTDDRDVWKTRCRECNGLVPTKPYCYECGAERPADGDFYVSEEVGGR